MPDDDRFRLSGDLAPQAGGLEGSAFPLGLFGRPRQPVGVVHPVVVTASAEQRDEQYSVPHLSFPSPSLDWSSSHTRPGSRLWRLPAKRPWSSGWRTGT